jgi:hypothetical protein
VKRATSGQASKHAKGGWVEKRREMEMGWIFLPFYIFRTQKLQKIGTVN